MQQTARSQLRYGVLTLAAILIAAPGVHVFELWLDHATAVWTSHTLALAALAVIVWRWRAARVESARRDGPAA